MWEGGGWPPTVGGIGSGGKSKGPQRGMLAVHMGRVSHLCGGVSATHVGGGLAAHSGGHWQSTVGG